MGHQSIAEQSNWPIFTENVLAAWILVTFRFIGSLLRLTVYPTVFSSVFQRSLSSVGQLPEQLAVLKDASKAVSFIPQLRVVNALESVMIS